MKFDLRLFDSVSTPQRPVKQQLNFDFWFGFFIGAAVAVGIVLFALATYIYFAHLH